MLEKNGDFMENQLALIGLSQIRNFLPVLILIFIGVIVIGFVFGIMDILSKMEFKRRKGLIFGSFMMFLLIMIMITTIFVFRDSMRDEILEACKNQGMNYTKTQWENGEVNYTKCNIKAVNGIV